MNDLIKIEERDGIQTVNARELWQALESNRQFGNWVQDRLDGFTEGSDFIINKIVKVQIEGSREVSRPVIDYHLTIDTAKHLAMLERNEKGMAIRQYFIEVEKKSKASPKGPELLALAVLEAARMIEAKDLIIAELAPSAAAADRITNAVGLKSLSEIGKINGIGPRKIFDLLADQGIMFRRGESWIPYQQYVDSGYFRVRESTYEMNGVDHLYSKTYVTGRGEVWIAKRLIANEVTA